MDLSSDNVRRAFEAVGRAKNLSLLAPTTLAQRDLISAASLRFAADPSEMVLGPAREKLNVRYADAMEELAIKHQDHDWILFFAADAEMNTAPWNYWEEMLPAGTGLTLRTRVRKAQEYIKTILARNPTHAGALHLEIHLFEGAKDHSRALAASEALEKVNLSALSLSLSFFQEFFKLNIAGAEHLLHMPSHAFIRAGMYERAVHANQLATAARFDAESTYPEHNIEFIVYSETALRREAEAIEASWKLTRLADSLLASGKDGYEAIFPYERFVVASLYTCTLFRNQSCVAAATTREPPQHRLLHKAFYHFALGMMSGGDARLALAAVSEAAELIAQPEHLARYTGELYPVRQIIRVISLYLEATALKREGVPSYIAKLEEAAKIPFYYDEPPSLFFPAEIVYGIEARDETVLEQALITHPGNMWIIDRQKVQSMIQ